MRVDRSFDYGVLAGESPTVCELLVRESPSVVSIWCRHLRVSDQHPAGATGSFAGTDGLDRYVVPLGCIKDRRAFRAGDLAVLRQKFGVNSDACGDAGLQPGETPGLRACKSSHVVGDLRRFFLFIYAVPLEGTICGATCEE